jgi:hypothetical protein
MMDPKQKTSFEAASSDRQPGLLGDLWSMLKHHKKYWLIPLIAGLLVLGLLVYLGGTAAAPFIYTLF